MAAPHMPRSIVLTLGSLFAGIGGLDLGLERAGMEVKWQVENDPWCQQVLAKHWPNVPRYGDIHDIEELPYVDVIAGGFPCQNISSANNNTRTHLDGDKSRLWWQYARLIETVRPRWVVVENVYSGWKEWVPTVRRSLWANRYASVCFQLRAFDANAPHKRSRGFVVGHTDSAGKPAFPFDVEVGRMPGVADRVWNGGLPAPERRRMVDGLPHGLDRLRGLGNAVVPQVAELIGRAIVQHAD